MSASAADQIGAVAATTETEIESLKQRRRSLSLDVVTGSVAAAAELEGIDLELRSLEMRLELCREAEAVRIEREVTEAQEAAEREQARLEAEAARLTRERDAAVRGVHATGSAAGRAVAQAVQLDDELSLILDQLGRSQRSIRSVCGELVGIAVRDESGVRVEPVLNFRRAQLLAEFVLGDEAAPEAGLLDFSEGPTADPETSEQQRTTPACSICGHESFVEIQKALAAGQSLRELEQRYGVSKSALSRHRQH